MTILMCKRRLLVLGVVGAGSRNDSRKSVVESPLLHSERAR